MPRASSADEVVQSPNRHKKSVLVAYTLWLFGGIFGMHHYYLGRSRQGFVWWTTLGGFGVGWLSDVTKIPKYVLDANEDHTYMTELHSKMQQSKKPPFSINRFSGMVAVAYCWGQLMLSAVPSDLVCGMNLRYLNLLVPLAVALGVWTVGNIGRERGSLKWPLIGAYLAFPLRYQLLDDSLWILAVATTAALTFDTMSKKWDRRRSRRDTTKTVLVVALCTCVYISLWGSYLYFNGTLTGSDGEEIPIYEAMHHFFTSPWWLDLKQSLVDTYLYAQHHGWYEVWKQIIELSDPHGEQNAYKVLGLGPDSTQQEITSTWRKLSRENHPDKVKDEALRRQAQERFMEIQQAYEVLSKSKNRRSRNNKKDNTIHVAF